MPTRLVRKSVPSTQSRCRLTARRRATAICARRIPRRRATRITVIGIETEGADAPAGANEAPSEEPATDTRTEAAAAPKARTPREGTKQVTLIAMLRAPDGATIEEIMAALQWAPHTIRGAMAGALKEKLGLEVTSEKVGDRTRAYKLPAA